MRARFIVVLAFFCCLSGTALARDVVFAVDATYPPMEMLDADKNVVGFAPELVMAIGKAAGFTPVLKNTAWDGIFAGLAAGRYDAICSSVSITEDRSKNMDFTDPYFDVKQGVIMPKGSSISSADDLKDKTVGICGAASCLSKVSWNLKMPSWLPVAVPMRWSSQTMAAVSLMGRYPPLRRSLISCKRYERKTAISRFGLIVVFAPVKMCSKHSL